MKSIPSSPAEIDQLSGAQLDYWVARAEALDVAHSDASGCYIHNPWRTRNLTAYRPTRYQPSRNWSQGGALIEHLVSLGMRVDYASRPPFTVCCRLPDGRAFEAPDLLTAGLRCLVALHFSV